MAQRQHLYIVSALSVWLTVFAFLWVLDEPYRQIYVPRMDDVTALADGLLLSPGAHWQDWFTRGHAYFFDTYPEWPHHETAFARPAFQFLLYLLHFLLDGDWVSYLALNYFAVAGVAAVAFLIARTSIGLRSSVALVAAALVLVSPPFLQYSIWEIGWASEPLASALVGCGFLALVARRDLLCLALLSLALLTKETAIWAPLAAALTVLLRRELGESPRHRLLVAAMMLVPIAVWLAGRMFFFGGIGGTYATAGYNPISEFLALTGKKVVHLHHLFVSQAPLLEGKWATFDPPLRIGTGMAVLSVLAVWALANFRAAWRRLDYAVHEGVWPSADPAMLVTVWAVLGLMFYYVLPMNSVTHAASGVMFAWSAVVGEVVKLRKAVFRVSLAVCFVLSGITTLHFLIAANSPRNIESMNREFRGIAAMNAALRAVPADIAEVYVVPAEGLAPVNPLAIQGFLGMHASVIRLIDVSWHCIDEEQHVLLDYNSADGGVTLSAALPDCASFEFQYSEIDRRLLVDGRIIRNASIRYDLPEASFVARDPLAEVRVSPGRRMVAHVRPRGPARFIVEHGAPDGGLAWFDAP